MGSTFSGMVVTTLLTYFLMTYLNAAPVCNFNKLKYNEIGLGSCGSNATTWQCPSCHPGYGQLVECGRRYPEGTEVGCVPCKENHTFSDTYDISQCKQCTRCQENEVQSGKCTRENDTIRCTCKPGYYRDRGGCKPCSWCCGDKTNEKVPKCLITQVPMGKQCSLQTAKNCAPTTPAPSTIATTTVTTPITSPMTPFTTEQASNKESKYEINSINTDTNDSESTTTDSKKTDKLYSGGKDSGERTFSQNNAWIIGIVIAVIIFLAPFATYMYCYYNNSSNSSDGVSGENSRSTSNESSSGNSSDGDSGETSGSTSNESSSATLLPDSNKSGGHVVLKPRDSSAAFHARSNACNEEEPLLPATRLEKKDISFICETLGEKIENLNHGVMRTLGNMLNIPIHDKDYKNLDCFLRLSYYDQKGLEKKESPMEHIFEIMISELITLESFVNELYEISRGDVVQKLYDMAKEIK